MIKEASLVDKTLLNEGMPNKSFNTHKTKKNRTDKMNKQIHIYIWKFQQPSLNK